MRQVKPWHIFFFYFIITWHNNTTMGCSGGAAVWLTPRMSVPSVMPSCYSTLNGGWRQLGMLGWWSLWWNIYIHLYEKGCSRGKRKGYKRKTMHPLTGAALEKAKYDLLYFNNYGKRVKKILWCKLDLFQQLYHHQHMLAHYFTWERPWRHGRHPCLPCPAPLL